jgi:hypothetical protein
MDAHRPSDVGNAAPPAPYRGDDHRPMAIRAAVTATMSAAAPMAQMTMKGP